MAAKLDGRGEAAALVVETAEVAATLVVEASEVDEREEAAAEVDGRGEAANLVVETAEVGGKGELATEMENDAEVEGPLEVLKSADVEGYRSVGAAAR